MYRLIFATFLLLASCAPEVQVAGFRDPEPPIYSSAVFDPAKVRGTWRQVADFAAQSGCRGLGVTIEQGGEGLNMAGQLCLAGKVTAVSGALVPIGPGRFALSGLADPLWILWADADARTLAVGTPSGRFGFILNRDGSLPGDRLAAAREVLAWNGYDLDRLQVTP